MIRSVHISVVLACVAFATTALFAQSGAPSQASVEDFRIQQQRARDLTSAMLRELLDAHLQQMEDNRLTDLPLYADLTAMRQRLAELSAELMPQVIELLARAESAPAAERPALVKESQQQMQRILQRLLAERDRLRNRRQQTELTEKITELITRQKDAREATLMLASVDEQAILATVMAQQKVGALYQSLEQLLSQASSQGDDLGAIATQSDKVLKQAKIDAAMDDAYAQLMASRFMDAATRQKEAIEGLERVMMVVRKLEDPSWATGDTARIVSDLLARQRQLRERLARVNLDDAMIDVVLNDQTAVKQQLAQLEPMVAVRPQAAQLVRTAIDNAGAARESIFIADSATALEQQDRIIASLAQLQRMIDSATPSAASSDHARANEAANTSTAVATQAGGDAATTQAKTSGGKDAWFTTLPDAVRSAMKARQSQPPPRGYEDRLRAYFQEKSEPPAGR